MHPELALGALLVLLMAGVFLLAVIYAVVVLL
jgi:hypothetical protein